MDLSFPAVLETQRLMVDGGESFVTVTLVTSRGSAPQEAGAKAVVTAKGLVAGTVGGGKLEARCIEVAQAMLQERCSAPRLETWNLRLDIGMTCGGEVQMLFEPHLAERWPIAVFGAGHVAQRLVPLLCQLACEIVCIDPRPEWLSRLPSHPHLRCLVEAFPERLVDGLSERTFAVLMTQGHKTDLPILVQIMKRATPLPYVGVIGSLSKRSALIRDVITAGVLPSVAEKFCCPIGIQVGKNHPVEIAISIAAQLLAERDRRTD